MYPTTAVPADAEKKPTILQVLPELRAGGVERGTIEIADAVVKAGWRAIVASQGGPMVTQLAYAKAEHVEMPLATKNPLVMWANVDRLVDLIRREGVDLIHARSRAPAWSAWLAAKRTKIPFVTTFHGVYGLQYPWKKLYNSIMVKGDRVIAVSNFVADHIFGNYEVNSGNVRIIQRGVDLHKFNPARLNAQRLVQVTKTWMLPDDKPVIILPGRITRWKGQDLLVKALAALPHRNFCCMLVGDDEGHPDYRKELEQLIIDSKLEGAVHIADNTPYLTEGYALSNLVIVPSTRPEAFGRVAIEAQAMGRLVIASNHGGARETVIDGVTGWLVPPGDVQALAKAIAGALALTPDRRQVMEQAAMAHAAEHFSSEMMCHKTLDVYWELIGAKYGHLYDQAA